MTGKIPDVVLKMLNAADTDAAVFPPTDLYNEGWMLRIVLSAAAEGVSCLPFSFLPGSRWFSEALLYSPFLARKRGDKLAEAHTHLDGVVGHFKFAVATKLGLELLPDSKQFVAIEAKMSSSLSRGVRHADSYDQAARTVACMAKAIELAGKSVNDFKSIGFFVLAPRTQIDRGVFQEQMDRQGIAKKVRTRIEDYRREKDNSKLQAWFRNAFNPLIKRIDLDSLSWESAVDAIVATRSTEGNVVTEFYSRCLKYNQKQRHRIL